jgi:hypothetical protein
MFLQLFIVNTSKEDNCHHFCTLLLKNINLVPSIICKIQSDAKNAKCHVNICSYTAPISVWSTADDYGHFIPVPQR